MNVGQTVKRWTQCMMQRLDEAYGLDQLGIVLIVLASVSTMAAGRWGFLWTLVATALLCFAVWRMMSRQHAARRHENDAVMQVLLWPVHKVRRSWYKWRNRKTKAYVRCPTCHEEFALPKGKGTLRATCPRCGEKSTHTV